MKIWRTENTPWNVRAYFISVFVNFKMMKTDYKQQKSIIGLGKM